MVARRRPDQPSLATSFEDVRADYNAARASRYRRRRQGLALGGSGADFHYRSESDYLRLMEEARDMDRNDIVIGQTIDRASENTVQGGLEFCPDTGDKKLDEDLWAQYYGWADDPDECDITGERTFGEMQYDVCRAMDVDGDIFPLPSIDGRLQLNEGHRCRKPSSTSRNVVHGILLDELRRRLEYWFTKDDINPLVPVRLVSDMQRIAARDDDGHRQVFHVYNPKRVSQTRGVTALAPIFDAAGMFEDINFAKLVQQQVVSCIAFFRKRVLGASGLPGTQPQMGDRTTEVRQDGSTLTVEGIHPGMVLQGRDGEEIEGFSPNVPNPEFFEHVRLILTLIGINLGLPLVMVLMDGSETNFSGWRGAIEQAKFGFRRKQRIIANRLCRPVWKWRVRYMMTEDAALRSAAQRSDINIFGHRWKAPRWPYIQPLEDRQAQLLGITGCLTSRRRDCEENATEWDTLSTEIVEDNALAIIKAKAKAAEINSTYKDDNPVHWRELISLPLPQGLTVDLNRDRLAKQKTGRSEEVAA